MIKVFLNDSEVEILDVESLGLGITYSVSDMNDLGARKNAITKPFKLPLTKANKKVLGFTEDFNVADGMNQTQTITGRIEHDGEILIQGYYKIESASWSFMYDGVYDGVIIGDNGDWRVRITNKKLTSLNYDDQDHLWSAANILASQATNGVYVYPLINYGKFELTEKVKVTERYPAVKIFDIVERIFNEEGYTMVSSFADSDFGQRLYLPFTQEHLKGVVSSNSSNFKANLSGNITLDDTVYNITTYPDPFPFNGELVDDGNNYNTSTYIYTASQNVNMNFTFVARYLFSYTGTIVSDPRFSFIIQESKDGGTVWVTKAQTDYYPLSNGTIYTNTLSTGMIPVVSGYKYKCLFAIDDDNQTVSNYGTLYNNNTFFYNTVDYVENGNGVIVNELQELQNVNLAVNLPDILQIDFIKALKHLFNLYFYTDVNTRTVYFEPRDSFYQSTANADWSDKLDLSKECKIEFLGSNLSRKLNYRYKSDSSDGYIKAFEDQQELILASHEETIDNISAKDDIQNFENPIFAPTIMDIAPEIGLLETRIPKMWKDNPATGETVEWQTKFEPRILYFEGQESLPSGVSFTQVASSGAENKYIVYPKFYSCEQTESNTNSLWFNTTNFSYGLFEKYYLNEIKYINEGRIFTAYFHLKSSDISQLDLRYPIHLSINGNESDFYILEITDYNPSVTQPVKVTLLKKLGTEAQSTLSEDATLELLPSSVVEQEPTEIAIVYTNAGGEFSQVYHTDITGNIVATNADLSAPSAGASHD